VTVAFADDAFGIAIGDRCTQSACFIGILRVPAIQDVFVSYYLFYKWLHILASVVLLGFGLGNAFYLYFTLRTCNLSAIVAIIRMVVQATWWLITPALILQPLTGYLMVHAVGFTWTSEWIVVSLLLYLLAGACWLPVVWLQIKIRDMAIAAQSGNAELPDLFWRYAKWWQWLGYPAFVAMLVVYWLMVAKPI
ncbi:MAG TPA: DUF2269 domain-containing protein, partial [Candidatus Acidoferrum sp.]|nr:DUF2269 domain-containing protein [Candidatus Acidoferrum sp.]